MPGSRTSPSSRSHLCWAHGSLTAIAPGPGGSSWPWEGSRSLPRAEQAVLDACWALKGCSTASCSPQHSRTAPLMDLLEPLLILHFAGTEPEGREAKFSQQVGICIAGMGGKVIFPLTERGWRQEENQLCPTGTREHLWLRQRDMRWDHRCWT